MYLVFDPIYQEIATDGYLCILVRWIIYHIDILLFIPTLVTTLVEVFQISSYFWQSFAPSTYFSGVLHEHLLFLSSGTFPSVEASLVLQQFFIIFFISFGSMVSPIWFSLFLLFLEIWLCLGTSSGLVCQEPNLLLGFQLLPKFILRGVLE